MLFETGKSQIETDWTDAFWRFPCFVGVLLIGMDVVKERLDSQCLTNLSEI